MVGRGRARKAGQRAASTYDRLAVLRGGGLTRNVALSVATIITIIDDHHNTTLHYYYSHLRI
jgi:hypothetical protein